MKPTAGQISVAARMGATEQDICAMFDLTSEQLQKFAPAIVLGRTEAKIAHRMQANRSTASKTKPAAPKSA